MQPRRRVAGEPKSGTLAVQRPTGKDDVVDSDYASESENGEDRPDKPWVGLSWQHKIKIVDEVKLSVNMFYLTSRSVFYSITLKKRASKIYDSHQQHQTLV